MAGNMENELNQLKEQIKLLERMVYLKNNVSSSEEYITKYMETQAKLSNMMKNYNMDSYNHEKKLVELLKQKAELEEKRAKSAKERVDAEKESIKNNETLKEQNKEITKQNTEIIRQEEKYAKVRAAKRVNDALSSNNKSRAEQQAEARKTFAMNNPTLEGEALKKALIKNKLADSETSAYMKDILKNFKVGSKSIGNYVDMNEKGVSSAAQLLNVGVQTFNEAVKVFSNAVSQGFKNQTQSYENNFTNIAVRTGMTKDTYRSNQMSLGGFGTNILHERGLMNNIRTSEVQDMWNSLANKGLSQEDIMASSLEAAITKTIVPYLDVTTEEMQQFNMAVGDNGLLKQIRGINKVSQDEFGSSMVTQKYMQQALEYMSPMADAANIDLLKNTVGGVEYLQYLQSEEGGNMSISSIAKMQGQKNSIQNDLMGALNSSDLSTSLSAIGVILNDVDYQTNDAGVYNQIGNSWGLLSSMMPDNQILGGIYSNSIGVDNRMAAELGMKNIDFAGAYRKGMEAANKLPNAGKEVTNALANDEFHTTKQLTDILAENLTNEVSAFAEMLGPWFDVLTTAVKGIAGILGVKLLGKVGGKLLGIGGKSGGAGFMSNFVNGTTGTIGGTIGNGLFDIGAASGYSGSSTLAAQAIGAVPLVAGAAGIAGGGYMIYDGVNKFNDKYATSADKGAATAEVLGGAAGVAGGAIVGGSAIATMAGVGAANAWNPVGWGLLLAAAVTAAGVAIYELQDKASDSSKIFDQLNQKTKQEVKAKQEEHNESMQQYYQYQAVIEQSTDVESAKKVMIEAGIATEEELKDAKYDNLKALKDLTNEFITSKNKFSEDSINFFNDISTYKDSQQAGFTADFLNKFVGNKYNIQSGQDADAVNKYGQAMQQYARDLIKEGKISADGKEYDKQYKHLAWMVEQGLLNYNYNDGNLTYEDYDLLFTKGTDKDRRAVGEAMLSNDKYANMLMSNSNARAILGNKYSYQHLGDEEQAQGYFDALITASLNNDKNAAEQAVQSLKVLGYSSADQFGNSKQQVLDALKKVGIDSYRVGTDSIPYDNYPALLHEGEAVLTASTANELRGLVDEYRATKEDNIKLEKAIQDQTAALVSRLDAIYNKIGNPDSDTSIMPRKIRQWKPNG